MDFNDKLVKAIYTNNDTKNKIVLEGSYAVYKVIIKNTPSELESVERVVKISDLDVDLYDEIEKLWDEYGGASHELDGAVFKKFQELFSGVIDNLGKDNIFVTYRDKKPNVNKRHGNNSVSYGFELNLNFKVAGKTFKDPVTIDVNIIKTPIDKIVKSINVDGVDVDVQIYKNEKYFANKLMAFKKHLFYYNKHKEDGNKYFTETNYDKLELDHFDIVFIQKHLYLDYYKIDGYLKLMGSTLMYDDYVKLINEWAKGGKK